MYLQTMGSEDELGLAWLRAIKFPPPRPLRLPPMPSFPRPPQLPAPPRMPPIPRPPQITPPRVTVKAPVIKAPVIKAPKIDTKKIGQQLARPTQQVFKSISQGAKSISKGLESVFQNFAPPSPGEPEQSQDEQMFEPQPQADFTNNEFLPTEEPTELTEQESEEMLGALTQGQAGMLNTGFGIASSFIPGLSMVQPLAQNLLSQAQKKPAKKPNLLQLLAQLQKKPVQPVARPVARPVAKPVARATTPIEEKKSDNTLLIVGGIGILALLMMRKKR